MSIVATRFPLEQIGMNGQKRRSARLSQEHEEENEYPAKKPKTNGASSTALSTKQDDGESKRSSRKRNKVYDEKVDGFTFTKGKRKTASKDPVLAVQPEERANEQPTATPVPDPPLAPEDALILEREPAPKTTVKKTRRRLPTTPEREAADKPVRRSKRISNENADQTSPQHTRPTQPLTNLDNSPIPEWVQPVTIEKKRKKVGDSVEEEKTKRFVLSFADSPIIQRNKQMRKGSGEGRRRSSSGMRGRRASSLIDEGRGNALPHAEVPAEEFFKHISAELTEPRRMRCLIGWCGDRVLPASPEPPKESTPAADMEFRVLQAARIISQELSQDLITRGALSDWFGRDGSQPLPKPLRKKPNPRNVMNAAKVKELEQELERLKVEKAEWDQVKHSANSSGSPQHETNGQLSPVRVELLDSPQRAIAQQLQASHDGSSADPRSIQQRLEIVAEDLEFTVDLFAHGIHTIHTAQSVAERVADRTLAHAADVLEQREKRRAAEGKSIDQMDTLKGLAKILNTQHQRPR